MLIVALPIIVAFTVSPKNKEPQNIAVEFFMKEYQKDFHPNLSFSDLVFVSIKHQKLYYLKDGKVQEKYDISTSRFGVGAQMHSQKTPVGLHQVKFKLGAGTPVNGIIKAGVYAGKQADIVTEPIQINEDLITTRILWLEGKEDGVNRGQGIDSYYRNIYIHGTAEEGLIGTPASHGCVRMRNTEVLELFKKVPKGAYVLILDH